MSNSSRFHPRYWPTWIGVGLLWLSVKVLPWPVLRFLGRGLGRLLMMLVPRRRNIARINLDLALPEKTAEERAELLRQHFEAVGIGLFEMGLGWWGSERFLQRVGHIDGLEHLDAAVAALIGMIPGGLMYVSIGSGRTRETTRKHSNRLEVSHLSVVMVKKRGAIMRPQPAFGMTSDSLTADLSMLL